MEAEDLHEQLRTETVHAKRNDGGWGKELAWLGPLQLRAGEGAGKEIWSLGGTIVQRTEDMGVDRVGSSIGAKLNRGNS